MEKRFARKLLWLRTLSQTQIGILPQFQKPLDHIIQQSISINKDNKNDQITDKNNNPSNPILIPLEFPDSIDSSGKILI